MSATEMLPSNLSNWMSTIKRLKIDGVDISEPWAFRPFPNNAKQIFYYLVWGHSASKSPKIWYSVDAENWLCGIVNRSSGRI
jgi:hypothetical protein